MNKIQCMKKIRCKHYFFNIKHYLFFNSWLNLGNKSKVVLTRYYNIQYRYNYNVTNNIFLHRGKKKIYLLHLERIDKHFLNPLTRNIDFQDIRLR